MAAGRVLAASRGLLEAEPRAPDIFRAALRTGRHRPSLSVGILRG